MLVLFLFLHVLCALLYTFLAFSGTNLLTRCRSASSCFLLFCILEKLYRKYSRNCTGQNPRTLFLRNEAGARRGEAAEPGGRPDNPQARPEGGPRPGHVWPASGPPGAPLLAPSSLRKNRKFAIYFVQFREYFLYNFSETKNSRKQ